MSDSPEVDILHNDAALHALKRPQLVALAKRFGLKGSGKNTDLIARLREHGAFLDAQTPDSTCMAPADTSAASWTLVDPERVPIDAEDLVNFGVRACDRTKTGTLSGSISTSSIASTIREKGATLIRALVDPGRKHNEEQAAGSPCTAMSDPMNAPQRMSPQGRAESESNDCGEVDQDNGGIRLISSPSAADDTTMAIAGSEQVDPLPPTAMTPFVFGSPPEKNGVAAATFTFSSMPGSLFASTTSVTSSGAEDEGAAAESSPSALDLVMAEMQRRAAEARAAAPVIRGASSENASNRTALAKGCSPVKGSKAAFDMSHKRRFDKMESITTHYAAKRALPSSPSIDAGLGGGIKRSASVRAVKIDGAMKDNSERASKRSKPSPSAPSSLSRLVPRAGLSSSTTSGPSLSRPRDEQIDAGLSLGDSSTVPPPGTTVSLSASASLQSLHAQHVRKDVKPAEDQDRAYQKRQLERAKARRKSQAAYGQSTKTRPSPLTRPSLIRSAISSSATSQFKSLLRPDRPTTGGTPGLLLTGRPSRVDSDGASATLPHFATSTAASSSRTIRPLAMPPKTTRQPLSPAVRRTTGLVPPPTTPRFWTSLRKAVPSSLASPNAPPSPSVATSRPSVAFAPPTSSKRPVAPFRSFLSSTTSRFSSKQASKGSTKCKSLAQSSSANPHSGDQAEQKPPAALATSAPATCVIDPALQSITNNATARMATQMSSAPWQPPAVTKKPTLPSAVPKGTQSASRLGSSSKKTTSSFTRGARAGEKARAKAKVEGLEVRSRKIRATATTAAILSAKGKGRE